MSASFVCTTRTSMPMEQLFDLARNIDIHRDSMAKSREQAVAGATSGLISLGESVTWRAWHFGVPLKMTSRITQMAAPHSFVDEQTTGLSAPFGPLGRLVEKLFLARYLQNLIEERNRHLAGLD